MRRLLVSLFLAALDPDLILVTYLATDHETYEKLAAIAPTIGLLGERQVDPWQDLTEVAGEVLRDRDAATRVVSGVEELMQKTVADLPGLAGKTFSLANYVAVIFSMDGDPGDLVGYDQLTAVKTGAVAELELAPVVGLNTPTPLSIPYSLEAVRAALEKAAA